MAMEILKKVWLEKDKFMRHSAGWNKLIKLK
jgi:hypothetical protein